MNYSIISYKNILILMLCILILGGCTGSRWTASEREIPGYADSEEAEILEDSRVHKDEDVPDAKAKAEADTYRESETYEELAPQQPSTRPVFRVRTPELMARVDKPEMEPLPLIAQDILVTVTGHRSRVVIDLVFQNPSSDTISGTLMVELPDRSSPCYLGMYSGSGVEAGPGIVDPGKLPGLLNPTPTPPDTLLTPQISLPAKWKTEQAELDWGELRSAQVVEPVKGRQVYEAVTRRRVDPALAEWAGSGIFTAKIFPIPPNSFKRIVFAYDQSLIPSDGRIVFHLPTLAKEVRNTRLVVYEVGMSFRKSTVSAGQNEVNPVRTRHGLMWTIEPSTNNQDEALFQGVFKNPVLSTLVGRDANIPGALVSLSFTPELTPQPNKMPTGKALFIFDTSYSSKNAYRSLAAQLLRFILTTDDSLKEFAVLCFDVRPTLLTPGFAPNTAEAREHYLSLLEQIRLEGATNFESVLDFMNNQPDLQSSDTVFLLSDGQITWGKESPSQMIDRFSPLMQKRWICYTFGTSPHNRRLFEALTQENGVILHASDGQDLLETARAHRQSEYRLESVFSPFQDEIIVAGDPRLLYPGQVIEMAVRMRNPSPTLRLVVMIDGKNSEMVIPLYESALTSSLAARAWAEMFVGRLLDEPDDNTVQAIYSLSKHFALANDYASFIILETDEEYQQHGIVTRELDFRRVQELLRLQTTSREEEIHLLSGMRVPDDLGETPMKIVASLSELKETPVWVSPQQPQIVWGPKVLLEKPSVEHTEDTPAALYLLAVELFGEARALFEAEVPTKQDAGIATAVAFRVLSSIAEIKPRDDQAMRLLGFVLMEWGLYEEAERIFAGVRRRRPFEPQNLLLEGIAQAAQGKLGEAALRYEIVLKRPFPRFGEYVKSAAARLYSDLLDSAILEYQDDPAWELWEQRREEISIFGTGLKPKGRLLLFWNLDDTDVDLHVQEGRFTEVWYQNTTSRSGGRLFWDNTEGLGPELYEHTRMSRRGFQVFVDYFSSSSVEGKAPAATFAAAFTYGTSQSLPGAEWHTTVLTGVEEDRVRIMPVWKRMK